MRIRPIRRAQDDLLSRQPETDGPGVEEHALLQTDPGLSDLPPGCRGRPAGGPAVESGRRGAARVRRNREGAEIIRSIIKDRSTGGVIQAGCIMGGMCPGPAVPGAGACHGRDAMDGALPMPDPARAGFWTGRGRLGQGLDGQDRPGRGSGTAPVPGQSAGARRQFHGR
jgi:hypothetical protein